MKLVIGFLGGVVAGAVAALLFAPTTGQELRKQLADEASTQWETANSQLQKSVDSMQDQLASLQTQVQALAQETEK